MPLQSAIPILAYLNKTETTAFYASLGFEYNAAYDGYIMCSKDAIEIHLWQCDDPSIPKNTGCYVRVTEIEKLYASFKSLDIIHPNGKLNVMPWGMKQFSILDNSGNIIHFGEKA